MADVGGSSSRGFAPADDTASGQQGGSSADPGAFLRREWRMTSGMCGMDDYGTFAFKLEEQKCEVPMIFHSSGTTVHRGKLWLCN